MFCTYYNILKQEIKENKKEINKLILVTDKEITKHFTNDFEIPTILTDYSLSSIINRIVVFLSKLTCKII